MVRASIVVVTVLFFLVFSDGYARAQDMDFNPTNFELGLEGRYLSGFTRYQISFNLPFSSGGDGKSLLEFPLSNFFVGPTFTIGALSNEAYGQYRGRLKLTLLKAISARAGTMKDSDWIENDAVLSEPQHDGRDLYSTSDDELNGGTYFDINYLYNFELTERWTLGPKVGYSYYFFEHDIFGCSGIYYSTILVCPDTKVIDYEVEFLIPYVGGETEAVFGDEGQFTARLDFTYSPLVSAFDDDLHILRSKTAEGSTDGSSYTIGLGGSWSPYERLRLTLAWEYIDIITDGSQEQDPAATVAIDDDIDAFFQSFIFGVSYLIY